MQNKFIIILVLLIFQASYKINAMESYDALVPANCPRQLFNNLATEDYITLQIGPRILNFYLKGYDSNNLLSNNLLKHNFANSMPGPAVQSYKQILSLVKTERENNKLYITYAYQNSRWSTLGLSTSQTEFCVETLIPTNFPDDINLESLELDDFTEINNQDLEFEKYDFIKQYCSKLASQLEKEILVEYAGLVPLNIYRTAFNNFQDQDIIILEIEDKLSPIRQLRKVAFRIHGDEEKHKEFCEIVRPSNTSVLTNFSYLDLLAIRKTVNKLILKYGYWKYKTGELFEFEVETIIPSKYPHEDLSYMTTEVVSQKVRAPISTGALGGINARDLGEIFDAKYQGLLVRSQYLRPEQIKNIKAYFKEHNHDLKAMVNLNIHGYGTGHLKENYSMDEIHACKEEQIQSFHAYNKDPKLRTYVDGIDPRSIPKNSKDRGNIFKASTVRYFISQENIEELGLIFNEESDSFGFSGEEAPVFEGNLVNLLSFAKNIITEGLPAAFHCKGGIHRTGQLEALFILLFAARENQLAIWSNPADENLNLVYNIRLNGYLCDMYNYLIGKNDKSFSEVIFASLWEGRKLTPLEWNYVLSSQGMPRKENINFIRDLGLFAALFDRALKNNNSPEEAYEIFSPDAGEMNQWVTQEIFMLWHELNILFNQVIDELI